MPQRQTESDSTIASQRDAVLQYLHAHADPKVREGLKRFAIPTEQALGIKVDVLRRYARLLGRQQDLADALWATQIYEARLLAVFVSEVRCLSVRAMNAWCRDFDSWPICDTACFDLFTKSPLAWARVDAWIKRSPVFQKRAGLALLAGLAQHNKKAADALFLTRLPLLEAAADDDRNFVKKGMSWALRAIGQRNAPLSEAVSQVCQRLAGRDSAGARWVARDVVRGLASQKAKTRL